MAFAGFTNAQTGLQVRHAMKRRPRQTKKFCNSCGGTHAGSCLLVTTSRGTRVRSDQLEATERRYQEESKSCS